MLLEQRHHPIIEQIGGRDRGLAIVKLGASNLRRSGRNIYHPIGLCHPIFADKVPCTLAISRAVLDLGQMID